MVEKYKVDSVVCDYGVYEWTNLNGKVTRDLKLICNRRDIALVIAKLMNWDFSKNTMTNGDVIKFMFPNEKMFEKCDACVYYGTMRFDAKWWDAPYQRGNG